MAEPSPYGRTARTGFPAGETTGSRPSIRHTTKEVAMSLRKLASVAFAVLVLVGAVGARRAAALRADNLTYLTFSRAVALPGVTLEPGTYAFELSTPYTAN